MSVESETGEHLGSPGLAIPDLKTIVAESRTGVHAMASWFLRFLEENGIFTGVPDEPQEVTMPLNTADSMSVHYWFNGSETNRVFNPNRSGQIQTGTDNIQVTDESRLGRRQDPRIVIWAPRVHPIGQVYTETIDDTPRVSVLQISGLVMRDLHVGPEVTSVQSRADGLMAISHTEIFIGDLRRSEAYQAGQLGSFGDTMPKEAN